MISNCGTRMGTMKYKINKIGNKVNHLLIEETIVHIIGNAIKLECENKLEFVRI